MSISTTTFHNQHTIKIEGCFDFSAQSEFQQAYEQLPSNDSYILDFSTVEKIDSSALVMLLSFRDYVGGDNANIRLRGCSEDILSILELSNFKTLFNIS